MVLIPGVCGSRLVHNELVAWPCTMAPLTSLEVLRYPNKAVVADEIITEWNIAGLLRFSTGYGRLREALTQRLGYRLGQNLVEFAYDWRQDCRRSAMRLQTQVERWRRRLGTTARPIVLAHSMGGLVARYWIERLGGAAEVSALILVGSPLRGTPLAFEWLIKGATFIPFRSLRRKLSGVAQTMPAVYQLLPSTRFVFTPAGEPIDIYERRDWLPPRYHALLEDSRVFQAELGETPSVPTVAVIGRGVKTPDRVVVDFEHPEPWRTASIERNSQGDGLIPVRSARMAGSREYTVNCEHEALLTHERVLEVLDTQVSLSNHSVPGIHHEEPLSTAA